MLAIRMTRHGTKKRPFFHIVVADSRSPRDGRFIEKLGTYNPLLPREHEQRIKLESTEAPPPRHYIYALKNGPGDVFRQFGARAKSEAGWKYYEIDASHNPHITCPDVLMKLLTDIMNGK